MQHPITATRMKQIVLLLALFSSATHAETILMQCGDDLYRYTSGFLGITSPKYERRENVDWKPFCKPTLINDYREICIAGEKGMILQNQKLGKDGEWQNTLFEKYIDFVALEAKENLYFLGRSNITKCVRPTRG